MEVDVREYMGCAEVKYVDDDDDVGVELRLLSF